MQCTLIIHIHTSLSVGRTRRRGQKRRRFETWFWRVRVVLIGKGQKQKLRRRKPRSRRCSQGRDFLVKPCFSWNPATLRPACGHKSSLRRTEYESCIVTHTHPHTTSTHARTKILYRTSLVKQQTTRHGVYFNIEDASV